MSYHDGFHSQHLSWSISLRRRGEMRVEARWSESGEDSFITHIKEARFQIGEKEAKAIWDEFSALVPEGDYETAFEADDVPGYEIILVEAQRTRKWTVEGLSSLEGKDRLVRKIDVAFQAFNKRLQSKLGFERDYR